MMLNLAFLPQNYSLLGLSKRFFAIQSIDFYRFDLQDFPLMIIYVMLWPKRRSRPRIVRYLITKDRMTSTASIAAAVMAIRFRSA